MQAVDQDLLDVLGGSVTDEIWLDDTRAAYPNVVLGSIAAERLGVRQVTGTQQVWLGDRWFTVIGILDLFELAPDLDRSVFIGHGAAETFLDHENLPSRILVKVDPAKVDQVLTVLGVVVTAIYANIKGWTTLVPPVAIIGGMAAALLICGLAGLQPAIKAANLSPTEALRTT